jgi:hypothetical protein
MYPFVIFFVGPSTALSIIGLYSVEGCNNLWTGKYMWEETVLVYSRYYPGICQKGVMKTRKCQPGYPVFLPISKRVSPEQLPGALPLLWIYETCRQVAGLSLQNHHKYRYCCFCIYVLYYVPNPYVTYILSSIVGVTVRNSCNRSWRPMGLWDVKAPIFLHIRLTDGGEVVSLTCRPPFNPRNYPGTHFCRRLRRPQGHSTAGRMRSIEKYNGLVGNRTRDLPACSVVPQPTTLPHASTKYKPVATLEILISVLSTKSWYGPAWVSRVHGMNNWQHCKINHK